MANNLAYILLQLKEHTYTVFHSVSLKVTFLIFVQDTSLSMMLYLADNLAYIPYTVIDEPLFLIHRIDLMVSVIGKILQF